MTNQPNASWSSSLLSNDVVLITGGARGIGYATAKSMHQAGARLVLLDRDADALDTAVRDLAVEGRETVVAVVGDVRERASFDRAVEQSRAAFDAPPSIFVSNAGITRDRTIAKMSENEFDEIVAIHLKGAFNGIQAVWPGMVAQRTGALVFISSISAEGAFGQANYAAAKAALSGLSNTAALEGGRYGIRSNVVSFGAMDTELMQQTPDAVKATWTPKIPLGRFGSVEEAANGVVFLASPLASYITGQNLVMDGGYSLPS